MNYFNEPTNKRPGTPGHNLCVTQENRLRKKLKFWLQSHEMKHNPQNHPPLAWRRRTTKNNSYNQNDGGQSLQRQNPFGHLIGFQKQCSPSFGKSNSSNIRMRSHSYMHHSSPQLADSGRRIMQEQYAHISNDLSPTVAWGASPAHTTSVRSNIRPSTESFGNSVNQVVFASTANHACIQNCFTYNRTSYRYY